MTTKTITQATSSYSDIKSQLRNCALSSAVGWAKAERMLDGQEKSLDFELDYIGQVVKISIAAIESGEEAEKAILTKLGSQDIFRGKAVQIDGKQYQPSIDMSGNTYVNSAGEPITDFVAIGKHRLLYLMDAVKEKIEDSLMLKDQRKLLRWKQKFHRYCYNFNDTEMTKYHNKISEFESLQLDARTEANAEGREISVIHHSPRDEEMDTMDAGFKSRDIGKEKTKVDNGGHMKTFADSIKDAYDVRVATIETIKILLTIPKKERKTCKIPIKMTEYNAVGEDNPVLI